MYAKTALKIVCRITKIGAAFVKVSAKVSTTSVLHRKDTRMYYYPCLDSMGWEVYQSATIPEVQKWMDYPYITTCKDNAVGIVKLLRSRNYDNYIAFKSIPQTLTEFLSPAPLPAQSFTDELATRVHGITKSVAHERKVCIMCKMIPVFYTDLGKKEYQITGMCEKCFDELFAQR
jgi:hypothetical protein